jgi:hypothetical protein
MHQDTFHSTEYGIPTNMSIRDCKIPKGLLCENSLYFRSNVEKKDDYVFLNKAEKYSCDFIPVGFEKEQWTSKDPRLISAARSGQSMVLDQPPIDGAISLSKISTDKSLDGYGKNYNTYSDINAGHITYYVNNSLREAHFEPLFTSNARTTGKLYRDPMGAFKPQYERELFIKRRDPINSDKNSYEGELSWIQDTQEHREDILSLNMRKHNEQRWQSRF